MVNPDPSPDEMTRLQREPPPEGFSDWSDDRSLNHVQQMFPNDDLQLYADESLTTPVSSASIIRVKMCKWT